MHLAIKLNAGHDRNGNPLRGWAIIRATSGELIDFVEEEYRGWRALQDAYPDAIKGPEFPIERRAYKELVKEVSRKGR